LSERRSSAAFLIVLRSVLFALASCALAFAFACDDGPSLERALLDRSDLGDEWRLNAAAPRGEDSVCGGVVDPGDPGDVANTFYERRDVDVFFNQDVRRYRMGAAEPFMQRLRDQAASCQAWTSTQDGTQIAWAKYASEAPPAGDEMVAFRVSTSVPERGMYVTDVVFIRRGDVVSSFIYGGFFSGGVADPAKLETLVRTADQKLQRVE
jgi:hypothetical protein